MMLISGCWQDGKLRLQVNCLHLDFPANVLELKEAMIAVVTFDILPSTFIL